MIYNHNSHLFELLCALCGSVYLLITIILIIVLATVISTIKHKIKNLESTAKELKKQIRSLNVKLSDDITAYEKDETPEIKEAIIVDKPTEEVTTEKVIEIAPEEITLEPTLTEESVEETIQEELPIETIYKEESAIEATVSFEEQAEPDETLEEPIAFTKEEKPAKEKKKFSFEALFGGRILNIVGSIMLVIGIGFFLKYAFDNEWINETFRALLGGFLGGGLIFGGVHFHKKNYSAFAQGLIGAGISILYLSIYAAHNLYHLTTDPIAFILMIATTILSFYLALRYNSRAISFLGLIGGFLTPFLLASDTNNFAALLAYIGFLNVSVFTVLLKKDNWRSLELFALLATYLTYFPVSIYFFKEPDIINISFLVFTFLIYTGIDFSRAIRGIKSSRFLEYLTPALSAFLFYCGIMLTLNDSSETLAGSIIMVAALVYIGFNIFLTKKNLLNQSFDKKTIVTSIIYIVFATGILFEGYETVTLWSIEALLALIIGVISNRSYIWKTSLAVYLIVPFKLFFTDNAFGYTNIQGYYPLLTMRTLAYLSFIGSLITGIHFLERTQSTAKDVIIHIFRYFWCVALFIFLNAELNDYFRTLVIKSDDNDLRYTQSLIRITMWALYSMPFIRLGIKKKITAFTVCGSIALLIATIGILIKGISFMPIDNYTPILNIRFIAFAIIIANLLLINKWLNNTKPRTSGFIRYCWCILGFILLNVELSDTFKLIAIHYNSEFLSFNLTMIRASLWTIYSILLLKYAIKKEIRPFWVCGSLLLVITTVYTILEGYSYPVTEQFIPIINLRLITFGLILGGIILINNWLKDSKPVIISLLKYCWCIILFILINAELTDTFKLITIKLENYSLMFNFAMIRASIWTIFSVILVKQGLERKVNPYLISGAIFLSISVLYTLAKGYIFEPIETYVPILNLRFFAFALVVGGVLLINKWIKETSYDWKGFALDFLKYFGSTFIFILITSEINSFFSRQMYFEGSSIQESIQYSKYLAFDLFWCLYSLPLIWLGIKRKLFPFLLLGLITLMIGLYTSLILCLFYPSIHSFSLIFNGRFATILILIVVLAAVHNLFKESIQDHKAYRIIVRIFKVVICGFIFILATTEATTFFNQQMLCVSKTPIEDPISNLKHQKQFVLSALWMLYSIILIIWGIYKRSKVVRITSMILFTITILKIFVIDLAFLDHLYRILSFVGMGVILIFASYLYQKYKDIILEPEKD